MTKNFAMVLLSTPELQHLVNVLNRSYVLGEYYGNKAQYWRRHRRIKTQLQHHINNRRSKEGKA